MTDRGLPSGDASPACPFVAFEDERDERADRPDHRHRCYAEAEPAPRALAHQEAYCLSSAFPVCPVFQEWARREAAHTRAGGSAATAPPAMPDRAASVTAEPEEADGDGHDAGEAGHDAPSGHDELPIEATPRRNPPRDWAAPPPWASGAGGSAGSRGGERQADATGFLAPRVSEGQGLAGSAADRLAGGETVAPESVAPPLGPPTRNVSDHPSAPADPELAGLVGAAGAPGAARGAGTGTGTGTGRTTSEGYPPVARSGRRPAVSSTRDRDRERERERERAAAADRSGHHDGPVWERQRRAEAYPQIKTRVGLPAVPRIAVLAVALLVAAVGLFVIGPDLLGIGGGDASPRPSPSRSAAAATATPDPTPVPAPTPQVYVIRSGDTMSKIAANFGISPEDLCAANEATVTDCDRIIVGNELIIPVPPQDEVDGGSPSP